MDSPRCRLRQGRTCPEQRARAACHTSTAEGSRPRQSLLCSPPGDVWRPGRWDCDELESDRRRLPTRDVRVRRWPPDDMGRRMAVRIIGETDFAAVVRWAQTAAQVVDAVGLFCYEATPGSRTSYRARAGVETPYALERVLFRACTELQGLMRSPPPPIPSKVPPSPAVEAAESERRA